MVALSSVLTSASTSSGSVHGAKRRIRSFRSLYLRLEKDNAILESIFRRHFRDGERHGLAVHVEKWIASSKLRRSCRADRAKIHLTPGDIELIEEAKK